MVGRADDALILHLFDQTRGLVIADGQLALDIAGRAFAVLGDDGHGHVVKFGVAALAGGQAQHHVDAVGAIVVRAFDDTRHIGGRAKGFQVVDDFLDLFVADEGAVDAGDL